jgi:hypothetical protein
MSHTEKLQTQRNDRHRDSVGKKEGGKHWRLNKREGISNNKETWRRSTHIIGRDERRN